MREKIKLSGVPETMLQTVTQGQRRAAAAAAFTMQKRRKSLKSWTTIFPLPTRILPCTAASLPGPLCWIS